MPLFGGYGVAARTGLYRKQLAAAAGTKGLDVIPVFWLPTSS